MEKKIPRTIRCHTYSLGASSVLVPGVVAAVATTPLLAAVEGWRSVPVLRKTPLTLANTLTIPFLSLSAFGTGSAGWAEELMMLLVGARATAVVVSVGEHLGGEKGFVKESDRLVDGYRKRNPMGPVETIGIVAEKFLPFFFLQALVFFFPLCFCFGNGSGSYGKRRSFRVVGFFSSVRLSVGQAGIGIDKRRKSPGLGMERRGPKNQNQNRSASAGELLRLQLKADSTRPQRGAVVCRDWSRRRETGCTASCEDREGGSLGYYRYG